jgi:hypothetical protein
MNFNEQYLSYAEYRQLGGSLDEMPFNVLELKARKKVDERTLGRLKDLPNQITEVKTCIYQLIESMQIHEKQKSKNISSESTDGYSVSYGTSTSTEENKQYDDIIRDYLLTCKLEDGTPYLYCGVK